jgi:hypothetical protein
MKACVVSLNEEARPLLKGFHTRFHDPRLCYFSCLRPAKRGGLLTAYHLRQPFNCRYPITVHLQADRSYSPPALSQASNCCWVGWQILDCLVVACPPAGQTAIARAKEMAKANASVRFMDLSPVGVVRFTRRRTLTAATLRRNATLFLKDFTVNFLYPSPSPPATVSPLRRVLVQE